MAYPRLIPSTSSTLRWALLLTATLSSIILGCGSSDSDPAEEASGEAPKYLAALATQNADAYTTYSVTTPAIDGTIVQHFLKRGLETNGYVYPTSYAGSVYVPHDVDPSITKYGVNPDGTLDEGPTISFAGSGVTTVSDGPIIGQTMVSAEKAYLFDSANFQAVIWNPEAMELTGETIDFADVVKAPVQDAPAYSPQIFIHAGFVKQVDNLMFVPVRWQNWSAEHPSDIIYPSGGLLVFDTNENEVVHLLQDPRIIDTIYTVVSDAGDLYLFTGAYGASFNLAFGLDTPSGVLKIKRGESTFDPDYYLNLEELTGHPATTPTGGRGTEVYLKAMYEEEADLYDGGGNIREEILAEPWTLISKGWRYWKIDLEKEGVASVIEELPWGGTDGYFYEIADEDRLFLAVLEGVKLNLSAMTLYEVNGDGSFTESISVPGTLQGLALLDRKK
jgi:hypothetical protein